MFWSDEQIAKLKKMRLAGFSSRQIAYELGGVTRNTVIGKIHRLGLSLPQQKTPQTRKPKRSRRPRAAGFEALSLAQRAQRLALRTVDMENAAPLSEQPGCTLLELTADRCKWPIGDPHSPDFGYCGGPREFGSYCAGHARIAYVPVKKRKRK